MTAANAPSDEVPGLQRERTLLAWTRTGLTLVVAVALLVRVVGPPWVRPAHLPAAVVLVVTAFLVLRADRRHRQGGGPTGAGPLVLVSAAVVVVGLAAVVALVATGGAPVR